MGGSTDAATAQVVNKAKQVILRRPT